MIMSRFYEDILIEEAVFFVFFGYFMMLLLLKNVTL